MYLLITIYWLATATSKTLHECLKPVAMFLARLTFKMFVIL